VTTATRYRPDAPRGAAKYQELYDAINELSERDRVLIHWIYWDGLSLRQIAKQEDCFVSAVHKRHRRILRDLRQTMAGSTLGDTRVY
jgi:RNA polymerase sigma factor (sigma-70 family)